MQMQSRIEKLERRMGPRLDAYLTRMYSDVTDEELAYIVDYDDANETPETKSKLDAILAKVKK